MKKWIDISRFSLGREFIAIGIAIMPSGRAKRELTQILKDWSAHVRRSVLAKPEIVGDSK